MSARGEGIRHPPPAAFRECGFVQMQAPEGLFVDPPGSGRSAPGPEAGQPFTVVVVAPGLHAHHDTHGNWELTPA